MTAGAVLMAHGTPDSLDDMEPYLRSVMKHRPPTPAFVEEIRSRYRRIGGRSPLNEITRAQAKALEARLGIPVQVGFLHWKPSIAEAVAASPEGPLAALCAAPHFSPITINAYRERLLQARADARFVESWHRQPAFIEAWAGRLKGATHVLFTAHSVPVDGAGPYPAQVRQTIDALAARHPGLAWDLAWQSRSPSPIPWLEPSVDTVIDSLHEREVPAVLVAPVGFIADNVEILYDLDVLHGDHALRLGIRWTRAPMLNTDPLLVEALAAAVAEALE